ncbi:MAG TPA: four helix bundle protein [Vicinamibacterales bacterium]|nr:four helix bundle protein [Vicinamibacterales bacterium]
MNPDELRSRLAAFSNNVERLAAPLFGRRQTENTADQMTRAATSAAAHYRAACRGRSHAEFTAKLGGAVEEADECVYWLEHTRDCGFVDSPHLHTLIKEGDELLRILGKSFATAQARENAGRSERRPRRHVR